MSDIDFAFGLEPKKAVEFLQSKYGVAVKLDERELLDSCRAKATRIANLSSLEMTKDIYQSLIDAQKKGLAFGEWKAQMFDHFKKKGWIAGYDVGNDGYQLADPKTGELFGSPRRLNTIYRTNMQAAYSAQRYQQMRDNADNRPYWQYVAVGDDRTRPSHAAMNGLIYRYDDPFWQVFYPPNGFNCRCSVTALAERDIQRRNLVVGNGAGRLEYVDREQDKPDSGKTLGFKLSEYKYLVADKGFDYNVGRMSYKPNLDLYPESLAHQFAKREMSGAGFEFDYKQLEKDYYQAKEKLNLTDKKLSSTDLQLIDEHLRREYKFAAGVLNNADQTLIGSKTKTVWLSDSTLIKQFNSRGEDSNFDFEDYANLPDVINSAENILLEDNNKIHFIKGDYIAVVKAIQTKELFIVSFQKMRDSNLTKRMKKHTVLR